MQAVIGRRPVAVEEIGLLVDYGPRLRKRARSFRFVGTPQPRLPRRLEDGEIVRCGWQLDSLIDDISRAIGEEARLRSSVRAYILASGREYTKRVRQSPIGRVRGAARAVARRWRGRRR